MKTTGKLFFTVILIFLLSSCSSDDDIFHNDGGFDNPDNEENTFNHYELNVEVKGFVSVGKVDYWQGDIYDPENEGISHYLEEEYVDETYSETFQLLSEDDYVHFTVSFWDYQLTHYGSEEFEPLKIKYNVKRNDTIVTEVDTIVDFKYGKILKYY